MCGLESILYMIFNGVIFDKDKDMDCGEVEDINSVEKTKADEDAKADFNEEERMSFKKDES